jgi:putative PIN family toxin of toxin-antitoxin system
VRVVLDTNVVISGMLWGGSPRQILDLARLHQITLYTSIPLLSEFEAVLKRPKFADRLCAAAVKPDTLVLGYASLANVIHSPPPIAAVCRDPSDDDVLACAKAAQANLVVSGDFDLIAVGQYCGIQIVNVANAIARIRMGAP